MEKIHEPLAAAPVGKPARRASMRRVLVLATCCAALLGLASPAMAADPPFEVLGFTGNATDPHAGDPNVEVTQAGAHPDVSTAFAFPMTEEGLDPVETVKEIKVELPPGLVGNPGVVARCTREQLYDSAQPGGKACPPASQVGVTTVKVKGLGFFVSTIGPLPVYNLEPSGDAPAEFGFNAVTVPIVLRASVRPGDHGLTVTAPNIPQTTPLIDSSFTFWGVPADPIHDPQRAQSCTPFFCVGGATTGLPPKPFITTPVDCDSVPTTRLTVTTWQRPDVQHSAAFDKPRPTGCEDLGFEPTLSVQPDSTTPDSPTGLTVKLGIPLNDNPATTATPELRKAVVRLPEGMSVSPSAADGLGACSPAEIGLGSSEEPTCPDSSKIGTLTIDTPLLPEPLIGHAYLARQNDNPFGTLLAMYLVAKGPGVVIKLPGRIDPDPVTGQLVTTFDDNPQLPFSMLTLKLKGGPRAPLATPATCGTKTVTSELTPWSGGAADTPSDSFTIDCPGSGSFAPAFEAGSLSPVGGRFSPLAVRIERQDRERYLSGVAVDLPKGLLAKLRGVSLCSSEQAGGGTCPSGSRIGSVTAGAGPGPLPFMVKGDLYLTEGYKGAPYGLAVHVPAVAGPFDLGMVRVRQAVHVDPVSAELRVVSDPLPTILEGIPLRLRSVDVEVDRPDFAMTPTSCAEKAIAATLTSVDGAESRTGSRFQVGDCAALPFKPRLALRLTGRGQRTTGRHPGVRARVIQRGIGEAGIRKAVVQLPRSLALDPENAQALCEFEDGTKPDLENRCPKGSIVGRARAVTPLLNRPLAGNVYFVKNVKVHPRTGNRIRTLPMIVVALRGEIAINLRGESSTAKTGELVNTFASVPDAPITRFDLAIKGGDGGILAVTRTRRAKIDLCNRPRSHLAEVEMDGQNGKQANYRTRVKTPCARRRGV